VATEYGMGCSGFYGCIFGLLSK